MPIYSTDELALIEAIEAEVGPLEERLRSTRGSPEEQVNKMALMHKLLEYNAALNKQPSPNKVL